MVIFIRALILYTIVIIVMRIMGKRQIGQLQPFELAIAIMISELAAVPMQDTGIPLINGIIPILTLLIAQIIISFVSLKSVKARGVICGRPSVLIENGKIVEENLRTELYTLNDLLEQLRIKDTPNIADVNFAILETNGQVSVIPKPDKRPVTTGDMKLPVAEDGMAWDVIVDGLVIHQNLFKAKVDVAWLENELKKNGVKHTRDVLFASLDANKKLYFQVKEARKGH